MKNKFKKNYKFILGTIFGVIISASSAFAVSVLTGDKIPYDNTNSKLSSTNVKDAIDEVNTKATTKLEEAKASCPDGKKCITEPSSFESDSWETIANAVRLKDYPYKVGDSKSVDMGDFGTKYVRISNTTECTNGEASETACGFVLEFGIITEYNMNSTDTNVGGWSASELRDYVNGTIYNALPSDLQNVIATTTVVSGHGSTSGETNFISRDKLYLLSPKEVWNSGYGYDSAESETRQLDYYKNAQESLEWAKGTCKMYSGTSCFSWWLRSASETSVTHYFIVKASGSYNGSHANVVRGVSPAFRIA